MSQLWVKRAAVEVRSQKRLSQLVSRVYPLPYEERRGRVGMISHRTYTWTRPFIFIFTPLITCGMILEARSDPHENLLTGLHLWLADNGLFAHDSIKALDPSLEHERMMSDRKANELNWKLIGVDWLSGREAREFMAINMSRQQRCA